MNIGSLLRGLMGDTKAGDSKRLDLKEGQVVRGVILSVSDDGKEAVVQIQGVKVRAALETPLQPGQATLLQVQPPGEGGLFVLRPLAESLNGTGTQVSLADMLDSMDLPDTQENRVMLQTLQSSGVILTKENAALFRDVMTMKPQSVTPEQWMESAAIAFQRGLPVTVESVRGLQQAVFGAPLHEMLNVLEEQLASASIPPQGKTVSMIPGLNQAAQVELQTGASNPGTEGSNAMLAAGREQAGEALNTAAAAKDGNGSAAKAASGQALAANTELQPLIAKLQEVLQQLRTAPLIPAAVGSPALAAPQGVQAGAAEPPAAGMAPPDQAAQTSEGPAGPSPTAPITHGAEPWVGRLMKLLGAEHEQQAVRGAMIPAQEAPQGPSAAAGSARPQAAAPEAAGQGAATATGQAEPGPATGSAGAAGGAAQPPSAPAAGPEPSVRSQAAQQQHIGPPHTAARPELAEPAARFGQAQQESTQQDTLKGILLQLVNHDDAPPALKETAQQLISQLTGQQLLLNTDRTAPFAQVTLFLPLNGPDGQETASVHVQSRRGPKGELDASNCRLWFDLQMKHLGQTLVDVQVVDRIVSLKVHNDYEWAGPLLEDRREEISNAMASIGYQLLTLKSGPLPDTIADVKSGAASAITSEYVPTSYKGVDMRV